MIEKKTAVLTNMYDSENKIYSRIMFEDEEYGFSGDYLHKDLGVCSVNVSQYCKNDNIYQYYLSLDVIINGREYHRNFDCSSLPTHRLAAKRAKEFLKDLGMIKK